MLAYILIVAAVVIAGILVAAAVRPNSLRVQRAAEIEAPPDRLYPLIEDFHNWPSWSPWEKLDPAMKKTLGGAPRGKGAYYEWDGNDKAGAGRMEITDTSPPRGVTIALDFTRPFSAHNTTRFTLEPSGGSTTVTWKMEGPQPFPSKLFGLFVNMDNLIGKDFEAGLANLRVIAEK